MISLSLILIDFIFVSVKKKNMESAETPLPPLKFNAEVDYMKSDKPFVVCRFITECSK